MSGINEPAFIFNYTGNTITPDYLYNTGGTIYNNFSGITHFTFNYTGNTITPDYFINPNQSVNGVIQAVNIVSNYLTGIGNNSGAASCNTFITTLKTFLT